MDVQPVKEPASHQMVWESTSQKGLEMNAMVRTQLKSDGAVQNGSSPSEGASADGAKTTSVDEKGAPKMDTNLEIAKKDLRPEDQTYLTFPEWFLVFSPDEMALALEQGKAPSALPWLRHTGQIWNSYAKVINRVNANGYAFNGGYHVMIMVIGVSTTVEYVLRGIYETTIGRAFEFIAGHKSGQDKLETTEARRYVEFIKDRPWYEFNFVQGIKALWDLPLEGSILKRVRGFERLMKLTAEWGIKAGYGKLIEKATGSAYEKPIHTSVSIVTAPDGTQKKEELPRYAKFTAASVKLAKEGYNFQSICGNTGFIVVSVLSAKAPSSPKGQVLFEQALATQGTQRTAFEMKVADLGDFLRWTQTQEGMVVEHVFDY